MKTINMAALAAIRAQTALRETEAKVIGEMFIEYELKKSALLKVGASHNLLGSLVFEFEQHKIRSMARIQVSTDTQRVLGEAAMRACGVEPNELQQIYTIDLNNGCIMILREGAYRHVE